MEIEDEQEFECPKCGHKFWQTIVIDYESIRNEAWD